MALFLVKQFCRERLWHVGVFYGLYMEFQSPFLLLNKSLLPQPLEGCWDWAYCVWGVEAWYTGRMSLFTYICWPGAKFNVHCPLCDWAWNKSNAWILNWRSGQGFEQFSEIFRTLISLKQAGSSQKRGKRWIFWKLGVEYCCCCCLDWTLCLTHWTNH